MTWNYWPLKFPDQATADSLHLPESGTFSWDEIGIIFPVVGWHVNIAVTGDVPITLQPYLIPFPMFPKRVFFINAEGVM